MNSLKIVMDKAIPFAEELFGDLGNLELLPAINIDRKAVRDADALIVRSVTSVNTNLVEGSRLSFVGTATIGTEHLAIQSLSDCGIRVASAAGCNALAVVQYVMSALCYFSTHTQRNLEQLTIGIVGVGNIGGRLDRLLSALGIKTLLCDPINPEVFPDRHHSLESMAQQCDVVTLHTPLSYQGRFKTFEIIDSAFLSRFSATGLLINAARGKLISAEALDDWIDRGGNAVLDVWPDEPKIATHLLNNVLLATAHIAGYSIEGKLNASYAIYQQLMEHLNRPVIQKKSQFFSKTELLNVNPMADLKTLFLTSYPIKNDHNALLNAYRNSQQEGFRELRNHYPFRRDFSGQDWQNAAQWSGIKTMLDGLV